MNQCKTCLENQSMTEETMHQKDYNNPMTRWKLIHEFKNNEKSQDDPAFKKK